MRYYNLQLELEKPAITVPYSFTYLLTDYKTLRIQSQTVYEICVTKVFHFLA